MNSFSLSSFHTPNLKFNLLKKLLISAFFVSIFIIPVFANSINFWEDSNSNADVMQAKGDKMSIYKKGEEVTLRGNSEIWRQDFDLKADESTIFKTSKAIKSKGNVFLKKNLENGDKLDGHANEVFYNDLTKNLEMRDVKNLDYFLIKENKTANVKTKFLKLEEIKNGKKLILEKTIEITKPFEELTKNNTVEHGTDLIKCDQLKAFYDEHGELKFAEFIKNFYFERKKETKDYTIIQASEAVFDKTKKNAVIKNINKITYYLSEGNKKYFIFADDAFWNLETDIIELKGKPVIFMQDDKSFSIKSNKLLFFKKGNYAKFIDKPMLLQNNKDGKGSYKAENIFYYLDDKLIKFEKNVDAEFIPTKKQK